MSFIKYWRQMSSISFKDQLLHLKAMTERIGVIHEAQTLQLRNYPLLIPGIKTAETTINIDQKIVKFDCQSIAKTFRNTKKVKIALDHIYEWVKMVVWTESTLEVYVNGKAVFDSRTKK